MGGGGFSMEPDNPLLDDHVLDLARAARGRDTAARLLPRDGQRRLARLHRQLLRGLRPAGRGDPSAAVRPDRRSTSSRSCSTRTSSTSAAATPRTCSRSGASTASTSALRRAWEAGVVMTGLSAGSLCWFETGTTDSFGEGLAALSGGLGFVPGSHSPHYDGEATRRPRYHQLVADGRPAGRVCRRRRRGARVRWTATWSRSSRRDPMRGRIASNAVRTASPSRPSCRRATWAEAGASRRPARPRRRRGGRRPVVRDRGLARRRAVSTVHAPAGRHEAGREVGQRGEHEQAGRSRRRAGPRAARAALAGSVSASIERASAGRSTASACPTEDEDVEVELARAPAPTLPPAELALEVLQRREQLERSRSSGPRPAGDVEGDDRVVEIGLVGDADRWRDVEPRDAPRRAPRERRERGDRLGQGRRGVADVRPETDVGADASGLVTSVARPPRGGRLDSGPCARSRSESCTPKPGHGPAPLGRWLADERARLARRHVDGFRAAGAADVAIVSGPPDATSFGERLRDTGPCRAPGRARGPRVGRDPAGDRRATCATWSTAAGSDARVALANNRLLGGRGRDRRAHGPSSATSRTCRPTTRCRAGSRRSRATRSPTCAAGGGSRSTSMARWTSSCSAPSAARPGRSRRACGQRLQPSRDRGRQSARRSSSSRAGRPRRRSPGSNARRRRERAR